jgi:dihydropteroate synthase
MRDNDIITAAQLADLIAEHGADMVSIDGSMPETYADAADLGLEQGDTFRVVINYGYEVQFVLISDDMRAIVTTGLKGRHNPVEGWLA